MTALKIILIIASIILFIVALLLTYHRRTKRKFYERIVKDLEAIRDEMDKYGVETLDELEAAKERERIAEIFPEMSPTIKEDTKEN